MKIYLFNRAASPNIGDQLINFVLLNEFSAQGYQIINNQDFPQTGRLLSNLISHFHSYLSDWYSIRDSDLTIIGGGNLIMDTKNVGIRWAIHHFWLSILNLRARKPYYYLTVGVMPFRTIIGKLLYKFTLKKAAKISVRDSFSKSYITELTEREDVLLMPDPVLKISEVFPIENIQHDREKWIGICPIQMYPKITPEAELHEKFVSLNQGLIKNFLEMGKKVHVFINSPDVDAPILAELFRSVTNENLKYSEIFNSLSEYLEAISDLEFLISARMHAIICATSYRIPSIGFGWQPKMYNFYYDNGLEGYVNILEELSTYQVSELIHRFSKRIQNGNGFQARSLQADFGFTSILDP